MLLNSDASSPMQPVSQDEPVTLASSPQPSIIEVQQAGSSHSDMDDSGDIEEMDLDELVGHLPLILDF
jgi:hypothetical protein